MSNSAKPHMTVSITLAARTGAFDRKVYYAPAREAFAIKVTNKLFALANHAPVPLTLVLSPSSHPAITAVSGRPGFFTGDTSKAAFVSTPVTPPEAKTFIVQPLAAGTYVLQLMSFPPSHLAKLIVR